MQLKSAFDTQAATSGHDIYKNVTLEQREAARKHNECFICQKRLPDFKSFKRHVLRHARIKKFKCQICDNSYSEGRYLKDHLLTHTGSTHTCTVCHKNFANSRSLNGHMKIHTGLCCISSFIFLFNLRSCLSGEKRYKCEICDRCFTESSTRTKHMTTHNPVKQFQCETCTKCFSRKSTLAKHLKVHVEPKDKLSDCEPAQECPICLKNVTSDLNRHIKNHNRPKGNAKTYACKLCDANYNQYNSLRAHMSKHTGKKEYCCDVCSKEFSDLSNLTKHLRIHSGDKR